MFLWRLFSVLAPVFVVFTVLAFMFSMVLSDMHRYETGYSLSPVHSLRAFVHVYVYMYMYIYM